MPSYSWTHHPDDGLARLDSALAANVDGLSRSTAQRLIREGAVTVEGRVVTRPSYSLNRGQAVEVQLPPPRTEAIVAVEEAVPVVFEDEHLVVVDKPAGIAVHPGSGHLDDTLVNHLLAQYPKMADVGAPDRPGVVHRLDRDTSGLLVFALTKETYDGLVAAMKRRDISRVYTALVFGQPERGQSVIDAPIGRDPANRTRQAVVSNGREARTRYEVKRTVGGWTLLQLQLETGRMHQIRVHLAAVGLPVAGDPTYGSAPRIEGLHRQFLHASHLEFQHPATGEELSFDSPLPKDLQDALDQIAPIS